MTIHLAFYKSSFDTNITLFFVFSMHWDERSHVGSVEPRHPLPESSRSLHQLYIRRREPRADMAGERKHGPLLPQVHTRSHRICAHFLCERQAHHFASTANHPRQDALQTQYPRRTILSLSHHVHGIHPRATCTARRSTRQCRHLQQLQPLPCEDHQLGRDHYRRQRHIRLRL